MIKDLPGPFGTFFHLVAVTVIGNVLLALSLPFLLPMRSWSVQGYPVGYGVVIVGIVVLTTVTGRILCVLQRANLDTLRWVTRGLLLGTLVAASIYCLSDLPRLRAVLNRICHARWMLAAIDYAIIPFVVCFIGSLIAGVITRDNLNTAYAPRIKLAVVAATVLLTLSAVWARLADVWIYPKFVLPGAIEHGAFAVAAAHAVVCFGLFPFSITVFALLLVRSVFR